MMANVKSGWQQLELLNFPEEVSLLSDSSDELEPFFPLSGARGKKTLRKNYLKLRLDKLHSSKKTLKNFLLGSSNEEAWELSRAILEKPGEAYPLAIFTSGPGLGKSHLLHGLAKEILKRHKGFRLYLTSGRELLERYKVLGNEQNFSHFIEETSENIDALFIDDIELAFECKNFQKDFCLVFDHLKVKGKQLILTGCESPDLLKGFPQKLFVRLNSGISSRLGEFDERVSKVFIERFLKANSLERSKNVVDGLSEKYGKNGYRLESALSHFKFLTTPRKTKAGEEILSNNDIDEESPQKEIKTGETRQLLNKVPVLEGETLLNVAKYFGVSKEDILSHSRKKELTLARHITMYLLHSVKGVSLTKLGKIFDRDHTSILYAAEKIKTLLGRNDPQIELYLDSLSRS